MRPLCTPDYQDIELRTRRPEKSRGGSADDHKIDVVLREHFKQSVEVKWWPATGQRHGLRLPVPERPLPLSATPRPTLSNPGGVHQAVR